VPLITIYMMDNVLFNAQMVPMLPDTSVHLVVPKMDVLPVLVLPNVLLVLLDNIYITEIVIPTVQLILIPT